MDEMPDFVNMQGGELVRDEAYRAFLEAVDGAPTTGTTGQGRTLGPGVGSSFEGFEGLWPLMLVAALYLGRNFMRGNGRRDGEGKVRELARDRRESE